MNMQPATRFTYKSILVEKVYPWDRLHSFLQIENCGVLGLIQGNNHSMDITMEPVDATVENNWCPTRTRGQLHEAISKVERKICEFKDLTSISLSECGIKSRIERLVILFRNICRFQSEQNYALSFQVRKTVICYSMSDRIIFAKKVLNLANN